MNCCRGEGFWKLIEQGEKNNGIKKHIEKRRGKGKGNKAETEQYDRSKD